MSNLWWNNMLDFAKEKTKSAYEIIKTDLAEFTATMTNDANNLFNSNSNDEMLTNRSVPSTSLQAESAKYDRFNDELESIQSNQETYLSNEMYSDEDYINWSKQFDIDSQKSTISNLLIENSSVRLIYSQIVPAQLSNQEFWSRYFYRVNLLKLEHQKRIKLLERTENKKEEEEILDDWEEDVSKDKDATINVNESASIENINSEEAVSQKTPAVQEDTNQPIIKESISKDENSTEGSKDEWEKISQTNENNLEENKELTDTDLESVKKLDDWDDWDN